MGKKTMGEIDLTHTIAEGRDQSLPSFPRYKRKVIVDGPMESLGGVYVYAAEFSSPEHSGTHTDAPKHVGDGKMTIDQIPFSQFSGPGVVIDISDKAAANPDSTLDVADIQHWEEQHGRIPKNAVVIMNSGWHKHYADDDKY